MFGKNKDMTEYVVEFCTDVPICSMALFRNNPHRDFRGKYYAFGDYIYSKGDPAFIMEGECILFVSDSPNPYVFKACDNKSAIIRYKRYIRKLDKARRYLSKYWGMGL